MGKTIRGARKGKNSIFTAHTRLRKGPVRLRKIDYAEEMRGSLSVHSSTDRWRNGSASDSSPEGYVFRSRIGHSSTEPRWSGGWTSSSTAAFATERFDSVWAATAGLV